jgi:hypothetical protein
MNVSLRPPASSFQFGTEMDAASGVAESRKLGAGSWKLEAGK